MDRMLTLLRTAGAAFLGGTLAVLLFYRLSRDNPAHHSHPSVAVGEVVAALRWATVFVTGAGLSAAADVLWRRRQGRER